MIYRLEIQKELRVTFRVHRTYVQISSYAYLGHIRALQGSRVDICVKEYLAKVYLIENNLQAEFN